MAGPIALFEYDGYLSFLNDLVTLRDSHQQTRAELAHAMGCQPAYFSQVLKGRVQLTEDQGYRLCTFLEFDLEETEFFLLLLRKDRAATPYLAGYLESRRRQILTERSKIDSRLASKKRSTFDELNIYYSSDWVPSIVHLATSCEDFQTANAIANRLGLSEELIVSHLEKLERYGLVNHEKGRWKFSGQSIHFPKASPLDHQFQVNRRLLALHSIAKRDPANMHYSVVFAANDPTFLKLRALFIEAIASMHKVVEPSSSEDVYSLSLDLFKA